MLESRSDQLEWMDRDTFDQDSTEASFRFIEWVNRCCGGQKTVWRFVQQQTKKLQTDRPLRVLDIGSGSCDIPIAVCRQAREAGRRLQWVCVEPNPHAVARARRNLQAHPDLPIDICMETIAAHRPQKPYDIAVASMVCHHFCDRDIVDMVTHLQDHVTHCLLINDLGRCWPNFLGAALLTLPLPTVVRHDAMVSVKRGFVPAELDELLGPIPGLKVQSRWTWPFRVNTLVHCRGQETQPPANPNPGECR